MAGTGQAGFSGDGGPATAATLDEPEGIALDSVGNLYVADMDNHVIRKVTMATGIIETVAGVQSAGCCASSGDGGPATQARIDEPFWVAFDGADNLFIADHASDNVRRVAAGTGIIATVAGDASAPGYSGDGGPATAAGLHNPLGLLVDPAGTLYIADSRNDAVRTVSPSGTITTWAGGVPGYAGEGMAATLAAFYRPEGVVADAEGNYFVADSRGHTVRRIDAATGIVTTVAGNGVANPFSGTGTYSGDGGPAAQAGLNHPAGLALDTQGNLFIADQMNDRVRKVDATTGIITTVAGDGTSGYAGDGGPATAAKLKGVRDVDVDADGVLFIADGDNRVVRVVDAAGTISTFAGNGSWVYPGDGGPATQAGIDEPWGVAVDGVGNVAIASRTGHRVLGVRRSDGVIGTLAGTGTPGYSGDGGPATAARLWGPAGVAFDAAGNLVVADSDNHAVRRLDAATGVITTVAGNGTQGYSGDGGPATEASLSTVLAVAAFRGEVLIADRDNDVVRRVAVRPSGPAGGALSLFETLGAANPSHAHTCVCHVGAPVNTSTGNFWHTFADLVVPGRGPDLALDRTYNSLAAAQPGPFGYGGRAP